MSYRSEKFNARMRSLDTMVGGRDASKWPLMSDKGAGVERMLDAIDGPDPEREKAEDAVEKSRKAKYNAARKRLNRAGLGYLVPTLALIVNNGTNRQESIWTMAQYLKRPCTQRK